MGTSNTLEPIKACLGSSGWIIKSGAVYAGLDNSEVLC